MNKYEMIFEALQEKVNNGELTLENASKLNDLAYEKYCVEASGENKDLELIDKLRELVEAGKVKLSKDTKECIEELIEDASEEEQPEEDEKSDEQPEEEEKDPKEESEE